MDYFEAESVSSEWVRDSTQGYLTEGLRNTVTEKYSTLSTKEQGRIVIIKLMLDKIFFI